ncbi:spore germination protein PE [Scopulibacillus darangshiensis]|uniref:Spore germination protein PE n=1 Tax=Scopulibacillus darangshiensis TaxID=442528 RepID=A0A4R2PBA7_9BACL|nr:spore germination protein GerPE [Scopulibacillus darangshiensis]TCP31594.1 spore germination protein PE [Scopulibacillus darangshiensis]
MLVRPSLVHDIHIDSVTLSSVLEIGDSRRLTPSSKVFAVQREYPFYDSRKAVLQNHLFFVPLLKANIYEPVQTTIVNEPNSSIKVDHLRIIAVSNASVVEIGSTGDIYCEARTKNVRQFINPPKEL